MADAQSILTPLDIPKTVKADAWDAYHSAGNADDLTARLKKLPLSNSVRADLWDAKQAELQNGAPAASHTDDPNQHGFFRSIWDHVKTAPQGIIQLATAVSEAERGNFEPGKQLIQGIANASGGELDKAHRDLQDALDSSLPAGARAAGAYGAVVHGLGAIPVIGPAAVATGEHAGNQFGAGNYAGAAGTLAAGIAEQLIPKALELVPARTAVKVGGVIPRGLNDVEQAAVDFGDKHGINTAQVSNNTLIKGAQQLTAATPGGSIPATIARARVASQLRNTAADLLDQVRPGEVSPELAGQTTQEALNSKAALSNVEANNAYDRFRAIEAEPRNVESVQVGTKQAGGGSVLDAQGKPLPPQTVPVMQSIALPISYAPIKARIGPIVDALTDRTSLLKQQANPALTTMQSMLKQPDFVQASHAEEDLGALKSILRDDNASPRAKALASQAIDALDQQIMTAAAKAGPDAVDALKAGRQSTYDQYRTQSVLDQVTNKGDEPVATFRKLTARQDTNINALRAVVKETPDVAPQIGRAFLQDLFDTATDEGGFSGEAGILRKWQNLGDSTKKVLFNPMQIEDLDNFFLLAKKIRETANPSGTGAMNALRTAAGAGSGVGAWFNLPAVIATNVGTAGLATLLYSPKGIRLLTQGMKVPIGNTVQAAKIAAQIQNLLDKISPAEAK